MEKKIPFPVLYRLSNLFSILTDLESCGSNKVSSSELGMQLGLTSHTIRKDIHYLGIAGSAGAKYSIHDLKELIATNLGFNRRWRSCIIGLGRLGSALLDYCLSMDEAMYSIEAAFDSNVNRLETIRTPIEVFPAHRISEIVREREIEIALIAIPHQQAQDVADRCCNGGICGLLNFSSAVLQPLTEDVFVRNIDITRELRTLSALAFTGGKINKQIERE